MSEMLESLASTHKITIKLEKLSSSANIPLKTPDFYFKPRALHSKRADSFLCDLHLLYSQTLSAYFACMIELADDDDSMIGDSNADDVLENRGGEGVEAKGKIT